ncbi:Ulp1 protease family, C-terminal catalytic domain [Nesidiocoris tenuis]|uniref:Transmembrane protein 242 n=1 Tax=Nesidiocoris tenuis TaxID=355587 RepID=A0ABN7B9G8_9HEMI|nr:Ulp1 protease family, C-terminal catalytic domain [Nesidiocoris tenuis]
MESSTQEKKKFMNFNDRMQAGLFLGSISALAATGAFFATLAAAKRKDPKMFEQGTNLAMRVRGDYDESGVELALRALKWGTFYAVTGTGLICYGIWKLSGAKSMEDFRLRMGNILPKIPKNEVPVGRTEFAGLNDLLTYVSGDYQNETKSIKSPES